MINNDGPSNDTVFSIIAWLYTSLNIKEY